MLLRNYTYREALRAPLEPVLRVLISRIFAFYDRSLQHVVITLAQLPRSRLTYRWALCLLPFALSPDLERG